MKNQDSNEQKRASNVYVRSSNTILLHDFIDKFYDALKLRLYTGSKDIVSMNVFYQGLMRFEEGGRYGIFREIAYQMGRDPERLYHYYYNTVVSRFCPNLTNQDKHLVVEYIMRNKMEVRNVMRSKIWLLLKQSYGEAQPSRTKFNNFFDRTFRKIFKYQPPRNARKVGQPKMPKSRYIRIRKIQPGEKQTPKKNVSQEDVLCLVSLLTTSFKVQTKK